MKSFILLILLGSSTLSYASQKYTDYEGTVRIQNSGIDASYFNPVGLARAIKEETQADWVDLTGVRKSTNPLKNLFAATDGMRIIPMVINFVTKRGERFFSYECSAGYFEKDKHLVIMNEDCMGGLYKPFRYNEGLILKSELESPFVVLDCEYKKLLGWANGTSAGIDYYTAPVVEHFRKTIYLDTKTNSAMDLGLFRIEYDSSKKEIKLLENDPNNPLLKYFSNYQTAKLNGVLLTISRGPVSASDGKSVPYEIQSTCRIR